MTSRTAATCLGPLAAALLLARPVAGPCRPHFDASQPTEREAAARAFVLRYMDRFAAGDLPGMAAVVTAHEGNRKGLLDYQRALFATSTRVSVTGLRVRIRDDDGENVLARVLFRWHWTETGDGKRHDAGFAWDVVVRREQGEWRWYVQRNARDWLHDRLVAEQDATARADLLVDHRDLLDDSVPYRLREGANAAHKRDDKEALRLNALAFDVAEAMGSDFERAYCHLNRANLTRGRDDVDPSLRDLEAARKLFVRCGNNEGIAKVHGAAARIYETQGYYGRAERHRRNSLAHWRKAKDPEGEARALQDLGTVLQRMGRPAEAIGVAQRAMSVFGPRGLKRNYAQCVGNIGSCLADMGRYGDALARIAEARELHAAIRNRDSDATLDVVEANIRDLLGDGDRALELYRRSGATAHELGDENDEMIAWHNVAATLADRGRTTEALDAGLKSLALARGLGDVQFLAQVYGVLSTAALKEKDNTRALGLAVQRRSVAMANSDAVQTAGALIQIGSALSALGRTTEAIEHFRVGRREAARVGHTALVMSAATAEGNLRIRREEWQRALEAFGVAARCLEQSRDEVREQTLKTTFLADHVGPYQGLFVALHRLGDPYGALAVSERLKARTLLDLLQGARVDLVRSMSPAERAREAGLQAALADAARRVPNAVTSDERDALLDARTRARLDLEQFRATLYLRHPALRLRRSNPATSGDPGRSGRELVASVCSRLLAASPRSAVVTYLPTMEAVVAFVIRRGEGGAPAVRMVTTPYPLADLRDDTLELRRQCASPSGSPEVASLRLHAGLVAPLEPHLKGIDHLVLVPEGTLNVLPFAALQDASGRSLLSRRAISYAPSVSALLEIWGRRPPARPRVPLAALGAPVMPAPFTPLPATQGEVADIAALRPGSVARAGRDATEAEARRLLASAAAVHFATHGTLDEEAPMESAVVLTAAGRSDGLLQAREIADVDIAADIVVLSACRTALGQRLRGEGVLGLTWALLVGGAHSVVATQWQVYDASTRALMVDFHRARLGSGAAGSAEALRRAQLRLAADPRYAHPYYWAPFVLTGAWR